MPSRSARPATAAAKPAGLLFGAIEGSPTPDLLEDLGNLAAAVAPIGGSQLIFVAGPSAFAKIRLRHPDFPFAVFPSGAVDANQIIAVAAPALVFAIAPVPSIDASGEAAIHMSTVPLPLVAGATADPIRSAFQTASVVLRLILDATWALRAPGSAAVATVTGSQW